ncbi:hypothetical protein [Kitasatospora viridis]|uniref:Holliday junction resolvase RuvC n=1 Tax=Kitasatospora viridis TaxID=281105 RepID=A0A561SA84_9ACTN|nr:hypothetical protein [Kitasatospora viridis]TWF71782.1 hypothetical protein FHX73_18153 [Kitasatospora viridis]
MTPPDQNRSARNTSGSGRPLIPAQRGQLVFDTVHEIEEQARRRQPTWQAPIPRDFAYGCVLAFDQTTSNTGTAVITHLPGAGLRIAYTETVRPAETALTSHEGSYAKAAQIRRGVRQVLARTQPHLGSEPHYVFERPSVTGHRTDSALLAGLVVYEETDGRAVLVSNRHAKRVLVGPVPKGTTITKRQVKEAVGRYFPEPPPSSSWNEHVRDAIMLGLVHLFDLKQRETAE